MQGAARRAGKNSTVESVTVSRGDEYVSTIKSRRSATIMPQVPGNLVKILVHSGKHVKSGELLMVIDPLKQEATVQTQTATEQQKLDVFEYNQVEVERQRKLLALRRSHQSGYAGPGRAGIQKLQSRLRIRGSFARDSRTRTGLLQYSRAF